MRGLKRRALVLLCTAQFVDVLAVNVVLVALPSIRADLGLSAAQVGWVVNAYVLPFAGCLVLAGRLADVLGRRRLFIAGLALFTAASLVCALAGDAAVLLAGRAAQGLGAALTAPAALALITTATRPGRERDRALAAWTAVAAAGGAAGLVLGGAITETVGWPWVFLLNVPIGVAALVLAPRVLRESRDEDAPRVVDAVGAATVTGGLALVVLGLTEIERAGLTAPLPLACLLTGTALLGAFPRVERQVRAPLVPPEALRDGSLRAAALVGGALTAVTGASAVLLTIHLQDVRGVGPAAAGLAALPFSLAVVAGSAVGASVLQRTGPRRTATCGLALVAAAGLLASRVTEGSGAALVAAWGALAGAGLGAASVAATRAGTGALAEGRRGLASGVLSSAAQAGTALGLAALLTLAHVASSAETADATSGDSAVEGTRIALLAGAVLASVATAAARRL